MHVLARDLASFDSLLCIFLEGVGLIGFPESLEVGLLVWLLLNLMWVDNVVLVQQLGGAFGEGEVLSLKELSSLLGGGVHAENEWVVLVSLRERVEFLLGVVDVALMSKPQWLWNFVVEESRGGALTELLDTEPLENVWLLSLTPEWSWSGLSIEVLHGIVPGLSGVGIDLPAVHLVSLGPLWHLEALVESSCLSVELHVSHSLEEGFGMEVLCVYVIHEIWLLVELIVIEVLETDT